MKALLTIMAAIALAPAVPYAVVSAYSGYSSAVNSSTKAAPVQSNACDKARAAFEAAGGAASYEQYSAKEEACGGYAN